MFGITHNECVGFESRWTVKKVYYEGETQTPLYVSKDATTNSSENKEVETQTNTPETQEKVEYDVDKLATFLKRVYTNVKKELDDGVNCRAFDNYRLQEENIETSAKLLQRIEIIPQEKSREAADLTKLSSFSWNCSSKTIAISVSYSHQSWCYDPGMILLYTFDKDDQLPSAPTKKISCDSCVSEVEFHPAIASILAGITHSSAIYLWNIQNNEDEMVLVKISRNDNLSCMNWITMDNATMDIVFLVTASLDGFITFWRFNSSHSSGNVYNRYQVKPPFMNKRKEARTKCEKSSNNYGVGVTCLDFSKHLSDVFIVGTEGGFVVQCSTSNMTKLKGGTDVDPLYDPAYQYYQPHESSLISVQFSKTKKDVFLTSGTDHQIRVYMIGQEEPARVIFDNYCLNILHWVPNEKHLMFGYGGSGKIYIFNVITGRVFKIDEEKEEKFANLQATCLVNPHRYNEVAVGLQKGVLELWSVPWSSFNKIES